MANPTPAAIEARGLRQSYRGGWAWRPREVLRGIDLELPRGARLGLLGPNGSGKSTLLRLLAGIERPTAGTLRVLGGEHADRAVRRRVGFLPEDSPFPRELRALEALVLLASLRGLGRARARSRAAELLDAVGLAPHARTTLGRFSRGMLRRFGLAQALVHDPELVLLDEPTAGLDALGFAVFDDLLAGLRARDVSLVIASHVPSDLQAHADRWVVLHEGSVAASGAPAQLLEGELAMLEVAGLAEPGLDELERRVAELGGRVVSRSPSPEALRALYRRLAR